MASNERALLATTQTLVDKTFQQTTADGRPFELVLAEAGIIPGIKVDMEAKDLAGHPGEKMTEGLDGLRGIRCNRAARRGEYTSAIERT